MVEAEALTTLSQLCDGDARSALNGLELAVDAKRTRKSNSHLEQGPLAMRQTSSAGTSSEEKPSELSQDIQAHSENIQGRYVIVYSIAIGYPWDNCRTTGKGCWRG